MGTYSQFIAACFHSAITLDDEVITYV
ncbi:hypothetical protein QIH97_gp06 [Enterobacter phage KNP3]|nr:hypothetical protein QIH97_gp06 [Enterobacter phage KNP3]